MKKASLILVLLLFILGNTFAQNKIAKQAIRHGKNSDLLYVAKPGSNSFITVRDLGKWCKRNEYRYYLADFKKHTVWFAGIDRTLVSEFSFLSRSDHDAFMALQSAKTKQREKQQEVQQNNSAIGALLGVGAVVLGGYALYKWLSGDNENSHSLNSDNSLSSLSPNSVDCDRSVDVWIKNVDQHNPITIRRNYGCKDFNHEACVTTLQPGQAWGVEDKNYGKIGLTASFGTYIEIKKGDTFIKVYKIREGGFIAKQWENIYLKMKPVELEVWNGQSEYNPQRD
jgi:hypothetical protein